MRLASAAIAVRNSANSRRSISTIFSCASRILASYSFSSGVVKRSAFDQRLLAFVILRDEVQIRLRDFEVVAEDGIELYLERADAGALALALLDLRENLLAVAAEFAQFVEIAVDAGGDHAAVGKAQRRLGDDRVLDALAQIGQFVERSVQRLAAARR